MSTSNDDDFEDKGEDNPNAAIIEADDSTKYPFVTVSTDAPAPVTCSESLDDLVQEEAVGTPDVDTNAHSVSCAIKVPEQADALLPREQGNLAADVTLANGSASFVLDTHERERREWAADCAERWPSMLLRKGPKSVHATDYGHDEKNNIARQESDLLFEDDLHTIRVDVPRTRAGDTFFRSPKIHAKIESLLTGFCLKEGVRYMQGLHEVAGVFAYIEAITPCDTFDGNMAFECFVAFVRRFVPCFYDSDKFVILHILLLFFRQLLLYHHPDLHNQLEEAGLPPVIYATPWFITLFASQTPLLVLLRLWNKYIERGEPSFMPFLAVAMMAHEKTSILAAEEEETNLAVYHAGVDTLEKLDVVWRAAEVLYSRTPRSFVVRMSKVTGKVLERCLVRPPVTDWAGGVLARVEQERRLAMLPKEAVAHYVRAHGAPNDDEHLTAVSGSGGKPEAEHSDAERSAPVPQIHIAVSEKHEDRLDATPAAPVVTQQQAGSKVTTATLPNLQLMLLDVRPFDAYKAEHMLHALHFYPPCLHRLVKASGGGGSSGRRSERLAAALSAAVANSVGSFMHGQGPVETKQSSEEDTALVREVFEALHTAAAEHWGEDWLSESAYAHLTLIGGEADWDSIDKPCKGDSGGAVVPLFEALSEQLSLARVSVVLGGATALHKEAEKHGIVLVRPQRRRPSIGEFAGAAQASFSGAMRGFRRQAKQGVAAVRQQGTGAASAMSAVFQPRDRPSNKSKPLERESAEVSGEEELQMRKNLVPGDSVRITGGNDHNVGKEGVVIGFDEEGDPQVRLSDGTEFFFCAHEVSNVLDNCKKV